MRVTWQVSGGGIQDNLLSLGLMTDAQASMRCSLCPHAGREI